MACVTEFTTPGGCRVRIFDDMLPKTEDELKARQRHMYEVCGQIMRNAARRNAENRAGEAGGCEASGCEAGKGNTED